MVNKFHGLPSLRRLRLMQQEEDKQQEHDIKTSPCLPAKKRKESRNPLFSATYCLPAKKRVWALQPDLIPISPFDLNIEYNPLLDEKASEEEEIKDVPKACASIQEAENNKEKGKRVEDDDDGITCAVCQSTDGNPSDPIVLCDACDLMVHATCYGLPLTKGVPEGDWFCAQCLTNQSSKTEDFKALSCYLCPVSGGAMKPTNNGLWAHILCALLIPEVFFIDPDGREGIDCSKVPQRRWKQRCYLCKSASGCVLDCSEQKCPFGFHVTCGLKQDLCIEYKEGKNKGAIVAGFCKTHTDLWKKQQQTGKFKIVARE